MANIYVTAQGDTFDSIAFWFYGDEKYMKDIIECNWDKADTLVFDSGVKLYIPDIDEETSEEVPFWRDDSEDENTDDEYYEYDEEPEDEDDENLTDEEAEEADPEVEEDVT